MDATQKRFTGWFIPVELRTCYDLSITACWLWSEIYALSRVKACFASNAHLAKMLGISESQIKVYLGILRDEGLVQIVKFDGRKRHMIAISPDPSRCPIEIETDEDVLNYTEDNEPPASRKTILQPAGKQAGSQPENKLHSITYSNTDEYNEIDKSISSTPPLKAKAPKENGIDWLRRSEQVIKDMKVIPEFQNWSNEMIDLQRRKAIDWLVANGKVKKDYLAFFRNWLRNNNEPAKKPAQKPISYI